MSLPFSIAEFFAVFADYNRAVWPTQVLLYALGVGLGALAYQRGGGGRQSRRSRFRSCVPATSDALCRLGIGPTSVPGAAWWWCLTRDRAREVGRR